MGADPIVRGGADGIAPWVVWNPASFFWSSETFAYFVMGVSCVFAALAYEPGIFPRRVRAGLLGMGPLGLYFLGIAAKDVLLNSDAAWIAVWSLSAFLAWFVLRARDHGLGGRMKQEPNRVRAVAPDHAAYWRGLGLRTYQGGPFADGTGGLITFEHDSEQEAERLAADDPFRREGLLERYWLKVWAVE